MKRRPDPLCVVEAAYEHLDAPVGTWLSGIVEAASFLDKGLGVMAMLFDGFDPAFAKIDMVASRSTPPEVAQGAIQTMSLMSDADRRAVTSFGAEFFANRIGDPDLAARQGSAPVVRAGLRGALGVVGSDALLRGVMVSTPLPAPTYTPTPPWTLWRRVAAHLATVARLRRLRESKRGDAEAILRPNGVLVHATNDATAGSRGVLGDAVRAIDTARTRRTRADPRAALELWRALVCGRWSLVDTYESDGKRFLIAHRNDPPRSRIAGDLTPRQKQVAALLAGGRSNKEIAYELGVGASSVETFVSRMRTKLGAATRASLAAMLAGTGLDDE